MSFFEKLDPKSVINSAENLKSSFSENDKEAVKEKIVFNTEDENFGKSETETEEPKTEFRNEFKDSFQEEPKERFTQSEFLSAKATISLYDMFITQGAKMLSGKYDTKEFSIPREQITTMAEMMAEANHLAGKEVDPMKQVNKMLIAHAVMILLPLAVFKMIDFIKKRKAKKEAAKPKKEAEQKREEKKEEPVKEETGFKTNNIFDNDIEDAVIISEEKRIETKKGTEKKETRGRKKGAKKNPNTGKFEYPTKTENGINYYSWGDSFKVK